MIAAYRPCDNEDVCPAGLNRSVPDGVVNKTCIQEGWSSILHWNGLMFSLTLTFGDMNRHSNRRRRLGMNELPLGYFQFQFDLVGSAVSN
jgi:hypothetical protein